MKTLFWIFLLAAFVGCTESAKAQTPPAGAIRSGTTQVQNSVNGDCLYTNGAVLGHKACGGGGGASPCGALYDVQNNAGSSMFGCDTGNFDYNKTALAIPATPTVTKTCTAAGMETCMTTYGYTIVARVYGLCCTPGSTEGTVALGPDTLNMTNFTHVVTSAVTGSTDCIAFRTTGGDFGAIWIGTCGSAFDDTGLPVNILFEYNDYPAFSNNGTDGLYVAKNVQFGNDPLDGFMPHGAVFDMTQKFTDHTAIGVDAGNVAAFSALQNPDADTNFMTTLAIYNVLTGTHNFGNFENALFAEVFFDTDSATTLETGFAGYFSTNVSGNANATTIMGVRGQARAGSSGTIGTVEAVNGFVFCGGSGTIANCIDFYAQTPTVNTTVTGKRVAYFSENFGAGGFSSYSQGGTDHFETGAATNVGVEIEQFSGQSADLFRLLDSDGTTVLNSIPAGGTGKPVASVPLCVTPAGKIVKATSLTAGATVCPAS